MAEESEEPSDGMTQQSQEKPQWVRPLWLLPGFLLLLVGSLPWLSTVLPQWGTMLRQWGNDRCGNGVWDRGSGFCFFCCDCQDSCFY